MAPILECEDITKTYVVGPRMVHAIRGVTLSMAPGEFVSIMGPSGSGKSTCLHIMGGLDTPTTGRVVLDGHELSKLPDNRLTLLRREKTGFVFQFYNLIPTMTVFENVALPFTLAGKNGAEVRDRVNEMLELVGLGGLNVSQPHELAGGEQQRVALARALVTRPSILLLDEPTGNLDFKTGTDILSLLWRYCVEHQQTVVLVTHDPKAAAYGDRVLFFRDGLILEEIVLGRREDHSAGILIRRLAQLGL